jgi:hypothetical protein
VHRAHAMVKAQTLHFLIALEYLPIPGDPVVEAKFEGDCVHRALKLHADQTTGVEAVMNVILVEVHC